MPATGQYTRISNVTIPSSAKVGETVHVAVLVDNIAGSDIESLVIINGNYPINGSDGSGTVIIGDGHYIAAGTSYAFETDIVMPNHSVDLHFRSIVYPNEMWFEDADSYSTVLLSVVDVPVWQKLDTVSVAVIKDVETVAGWQKLDTASVAVVKDVETVAGWQKLDTVSVGASPGIDWNAFELITHTDFPETKTYKGKAQEVTATFESLTVLGSIDIVKQKIVEGFTASLTKEGLVPLSVDLYRGKSGALTTTFIVKMVAGEKVAATYKAVAFPPVWAVIIIAALIIFVIIAATFFVVKVTDLVWGPPGKDSLIASIVKPLAIGAVILGGVFLLSGSRQSVTNATRRWRESEVAV
ncbi:MAG: hypothetical protein V1767_00900 [Chloroflexota bacterium]